MATKEVLEQLESRATDLGVRVVERKLARLEGRKFFLFFRVRLLLRKIRILKGEK